MSDDVVLRVEGLHSYYGRAHILAGVTLEARRGEAVALLTAPAPANRPP